MSQPDNKTPASELLSPYSAYVEKGEIRLRIPASDEFGRHICEHAISREVALSLIADLQRCFAPPQI
jgi:hypothetical protein